MVSIGIDLREMHRSAAGGAGCAGGSRAHGDWAGVGILCRIGWEDKTRGRGGI